MKKKFFLVGALVAMSMSAMFVACSDQNEPTNGCKCVVKAYGVESNITVTLDEMKQHATRWLLSINQQQVPQA